MESSILSSSESVLSTQTESMEEMELSVLENSPPPRSVTSFRPLYLQMYFTRSHDLLCIILSTQRRIYRDLILIQIVCFTFYCSAQLIVALLRCNTFWGECVLNMLFATCKGPSEICRVLFVSQRCAISGREILTPPPLSIFRLLLLHLLVIATYLSHLLFDIIGSCY